MTAFILLFDAATLQMLFPLLIIVVFYFFMLRPQMQQQKKVQNFQSSLAPNMEVVTNGGIIGRVTKIEDSVVTLLVDEKTRIRVLRNTIAAEYSTSKSDS